MKIDYAIVSATDDDVYFPFWPMVSKVWKTIFDIEPILFYFGKTPVESEHGRVIHMETIPYIPIEIQALWSRYWGTTILDGTSIISDIDMLPIDRCMFINVLEGINAHCYVHLNPCRRLPSCYHVARADTFKDVLEIPDEFGTSLAQVLAHFQRAGIKEPPMPFWAADEEYATHRIMERYQITREFFEATEIVSKGNLVIVPRAISTRIDRACWTYEKEWLHKGFYGDCHMPRPYRHHSDKIDPIVRDMLELHNAR